MAETTTESNQDTEFGSKKLMKHISTHLIDFVLWALRIFTIGCALLIFWNSNVFYYKALLSFAGISLLRLYQRLPEITINVQYFSNLLKEDSFHYILYTFIFFQIAPVTLVLLPIIFFCVLHSASYSLVLLDTLGHNSFCGVRFFISLVEFQSRNMLRLIALTEIFLMPFTLILIYMGKASLFTLIFYYKFLFLRYSSRRNPYTRNVFHDLRMAVEKTANKEGVPVVVRIYLQKVVNFVCWLGPKTPVPQTQ